MKITSHALEEYHELELDLCRMHAASEEEEMEIDHEYAEVRNNFATIFQVATSDDYEIPEWHHNIRMLWVYLYSDLFYTPEFLPKIQRITESMKKPWFAQFECYSPSLVTDELPTGYLGIFSVYRDSVVVWDSEHSSRLIARIQEAQQGVGEQPATPPRVGD